MALEVRIASPCSADWSQMAGDDRVRFCPECQRHVYNFSSMTEAEVKRMVSQSEGRHCGRFYKRVDGTMLAANCPVGFRGVILRAARMATATLAAVMSAAPSFAKPAPGLDRVVPSFLLQIEAARPSFSMVVQDEAGAVISGAAVTFQNDKTGEKTNGKTDGNGTLRMSLANGGYEVTVTSNGFQTATIPGVNVPSQTTMKVTLQIEIAIMGEVVEVIPVAPTVTPLSSQLESPSKHPNSPLVSPPSRLHRFFSRIFQSL